MVVPHCFWDGNDIRLLSLKVHILTTIQLGQEMMYFDDATAGVMGILLWRH